MTFFSRQLTEKIVEPYVSKMVKLWTRWMFSTHAVVASVAATLIVLQGLVFAASVNAPFAQKSHQTVVVSLSEYCGAQGGDGVPAPGRHDHSHCCFVCAGSGRDASPLVMAALISVVIYSAPEAIASVVRLVVDEPDRRLIGWTSSWSARAPPLMA